MDLPIVIASALSFSVLFYLIFQLGVNHGLSRAQKLLDMVLEEEAKKLKRKPQK